MNITEGKLTVEKTQRFALVVSRFNDIFTKKLQEGAQDCLVRHGAEANNIDTYWVSGCFEIPLVLKKLAKSGQYNAMVALGAVIKGGTPHFDYVCQSVTKGVSQVSYDYDMPIGFGIITTNSLEQALERSGSKAGNKGWEATMATIEQLNLLNQINID